jgi:hypothetical protein
MKRFSFLLPAAIGLAAAIGVSGGVAHAAAASPAVRQAPAQAVTASVVRIHFDTPQAAMRYMAAAWNRGDLRALHHVTTPSAFRDLMGMHSEAVNLKLQHCNATGHGDYICHFQHRYPKSFHNNGYGASDMIVAPAINPGWYMYSLVGCG